MKQISIPAMILCIRTRFRFVYYITCNITWKYITRFTRSLGSRFYAGGKLRWKSNPKKWARKKEKKRKKRRRGKDTCNARGRDDGDEWGEHDDFNSDAPFRPVTTPVELYGSRGSSRIWTFFDRSPVENNTGSGKGNGEDWERMYRTQARGWRKRARVVSNVSNAFKSTGGSCDSSFQFIVAPLPKLFTRIILRREGEGIS